MKRIILLLALGLAACSSTDKAVTTPADAASIQATLDKVQTAYTTATVGVAMVCAFNASVYPCNDAGAMAAISGAQAVLDAAFDKARSDIQLATTANALTVGEKAALDAISVYAKAVAVYGVKPVK